MLALLRHSGNFFGSFLLGASLLALMLVTGSARAAPPTVYTVGNTAADPTCGYPQLRLALEAAAMQVGGYAEIRIAKSQDISLGYTWLGLNSAVVISNPQTEITIRGGYGSCSATSPTPGQYTRLTYYSNDNDAGHTMLAISNSTGNARRYLELEAIRMEGASDASKGGPGVGGGLKITYNVELTLRNSRISGFHASAVGGGVALVGDSTVVDPSHYPKLVLQDDSFVSNNSSDNLGGGIYADYGRVTLAGATVIGNTADNDGGGIYLHDHEDSGGLGDDSLYALVLSGTGEANFISGNAAGTSTFSGSSGKGGGVYSLNGQILFKAHTGSPHFQSYVASNHANVGGGLFVDGPAQGAGGPFTTLLLTDTMFSGNTSRGVGGALVMRNAVYGVINGQGQCEVGFGTPHAAPCSYFGSNEADGSDGAGVIPRGGAMYLTNTRSDGMSRPIVYVQRTWFDGNNDSSGLAAVAAARHASEMVFNRNIFTNNDAQDSGGAASALLYSDTGKDVDFRYNTVLDSNSSTRMFNMDGGQLDVTGSILWGTIDHTHPFHFVWFSSGGADMIHYGCILIRANDSGTAGVPGASALWSGHAPDLDWRFAPRGGSAALDHCDTSGGTPPPDAYGRTARDVAGIDNRWGTYDLGGVEQDDIIFANMFGARPDN